MGRSSRIKLLFLPYVCHLVIIQFTNAIDVSQSLKYGNKIYERLEQSTSHPWEFGTATEVILERYYPTLSVYSVSNNVPIDVSSEPVPKEIFDAVDPFLSARKPGPGPIVADDLSGGSVSLGVGVMIAGLTVGNRPMTERKFTAEQYGEVAQAQLDYLLTKVPRGPNRELSDVGTRFQARSDFMYMVPPFLAYYGAQTSNVTLLQIAYDQCRMYRRLMQDQVTQTWRHVHLGNKTFSDEGLWSTGNGWSAAGLMRVYATLNNLRDDSIRVETVAWKSDIASWVIEIVDGAFKFQSNETQLLPNYYGSNATYDDVSGTALIASAAYRLATLKPSTAASLPMLAVDKARIQILQSHVDPSTGIVSPVVDPKNATSSQPLPPQSISAEGQAFVLLMISGWQSYQEFQLRGSAHYLLPSYWYLCISLIAAVLIP